MIKLAQQLGTGIKEGIRTRNASFLGILAIALCIPPMMLAYTAQYLAQPMSWQLIVDIGTPFWLSVAFSVYMFGIKAMQVYQHQQGNNDAVPKLTRQFDIVVYVVLFGLILSFILK